MHARQQILEALIAAIKVGVPELEKRVDGETDLEHADTRLPACVVRVGDEEIEQPTGLQVKRRLVEVQIEAAIAAQSLPTGPMSDEGVRMQAALNRLALPLERLELGVKVAAGPLVPLAHVRTEIAISAGQARRIGTLSLFFQASYFTNPGMPDHIL